MSFLSKWEKPLVRSPFRNCAPLCGIIFTNSLALVIRNHGAVFATNFIALHPPLSRFRGALISALFLRCLLGLAHICYYASTFPVFAFYAFAGVRASPPSFRFFRPFSCGEPCMLETLTAKENCLLGAGATRAVMPRLIIHNEKAVDAWGVGKRQTGPFL